jgi:UDP-glucose 4-epimerase
VKILVTGGAGYIGSHMVKLLVESGAEVSVIDDLSTGHADAVRGAQFVQGDIADIPNTANLLKKRGIEAVVHFAGASQVAESVANPAKYQASNVEASLALLEAMRDAGVARIVFSSSAAVYGEPQRVPIDETHPTQPVNPYGATKLAVEQKLAECSAAYGLRAVSLRYFNAAGADGGLGERHEPETHLIPLVLKSALGKTPISVYGTDYPTRDGTCVRDYVHVSDLCTAHLLALGRLDQGHDCFNLGNGEGFTVMEVIETARRVTGRRIEMRLSERRPGDPPALVADATKARRVLGWQPQRSSLERIVADAWQFEQRRGA